VEEESEVALAPLAAADGEGCWVNVEVTRLSPPPEAEVTDGGGVTTGAGACVADGLGVEDEEDEELDEELEDDELEDEEELLLEEVPVILFVAAVPLLVPVPVPVVEAAVVDGDEVLVPEEVRLCVKLSDESVAGGGTEVVAPLAAAEVPPGGSFGGSLPMLAAPRLGS